jgi:hypothetical protein
VKGLLPPSGYFVISVQGMELAGVLLHRKGALLRTDC